MGRNKRETDMLLDATNSASATLNPWEARKLSFDRQNDRNIRNNGYSATEAAQAIIRKFMAETTEAVTKAQAQEVDYRNQREHEFQEIAREMDPEVLALIALTGGIHATAEDMNYTNTVLHLGEMVEDEVWAQGLYARDKVLARNLEKAASKRHGRVSARKQAVKKMAAKKGYSQKAWTREEWATAGAWLFNVLIETSAFMAVKRTDTNDYGTEETFLAMTEEALAVGEAFVQMILDQYPIHQPLLKKPAPWKGPEKALEFDGRSYRVPLVRKDCKVVQSHVANAIKTGRMDGVLEAMNNIESVAWTINEPMLELVEWAYNADPRWGEGYRKRLEGLPPRRNLKEVKLPQDTEGNDIPFEMLDEGQRKAYLIALDKEQTANRAFNGQRRTLEKDLGTAWRIVEGGNKFWTPCNMDYRGRVYYLPQFNFQRQDYVRSLFLFASGEKLNEEGLYWLKVHVANTGAFDKMDKAPFPDRVKWVDDNMEMIRGVAADPKGTFATWGEADAPFMFVAACIELVAALDNPEYICRLPVNFDGSCSGLQHLAAMTRCARTATLVNVSPTERPGDIYRTVWEAVLPKFQWDAKHGEGETKVMGQLVVDHNGGRGLVKRNVMVYSYGSKKFGMAEQHQEDLMKPLELKVLRKELKDHPFAMPDEKFPGQKVAKYLAGHIFDTIEEVVEKPAQAMKYLQHIAKVMAHEGKPVIYHTPLGFPVVIRCPNEKVERVRLFLHDRGVKSPIRASITKDDAGIDKKAAANTIAPGFVHSYDACHLQLVANSCVKEGIRELAFVHDSFGCLPNKAGRLRQILVEQFYWLYAMHDVLEDIRQEALQQLETNKDKLSDSFDTQYGKGGLNIEAVLDAQYAFA